MGRIEGAQAPNKLALAAAILKYALLSILATLALLTNLSPNQTGLQINEEQFLYSDS